ncbi:UvrD-helicase domain-containing protein [Carboxydocella sp. ULO1]|uniref:HelD family protein n=1 Tax=Carboxydocella sp. ULO1 TaxID=1926599 RepID=UPI0009AE6D67|nr:UvrD-helicase domain-containing protein [Carboxydocella sp. ULO1]GAW28767.1 superfamily I DNA helicase [Carboxydocella sp. ULO1]
MATKSATQKIVSHPDYEKEKQRLDKAIQAIKTILREIDEQVANRDKYTKQIMKEEGIIKNELFVENSLGKIQKQNKAELQQMLNKPYFGRIDFKEEGIRSIESYYIGRAGTFEIEDNVAIVSWKAPVASLYYQSRGGKASYRAPEGEITGEIRLKRRFDINNGKLNKIVDEYLDEKSFKFQDNTEYLSDPFLVQKLSHNVNSKLKDIVETIQAEQNNIIREPMENVVLVQGVPGSGKTTIALHRISYLLYNYRNLLPEKIMVIAPSKLFLDYISDVLPDLETEGSEKIKQLTFVELAWEIIGRKIEILEDEKYGFLFTTYGNEFINFIKEKLIDAYKIKGSLHFKIAIDKYIEKKVEEVITNLSDINFLDGKLIISRDDQINILTDRSMPYNNRIQSLKKFIENKLNYFLYVSDNNNSIAKEHSAKTITQGYLDRIKNAFNDKIYYSKLSKDEKEILMKQRDDIVNYIINEKDKIINQLKNLTTLQVFSLYREMIDNNWFSTTMSHNHRFSSVLMEEITKRALDLNKVEKEDLAALCYLKYVLDGYLEFEKFQHIVVDEAQDLNIFEFYILKLLSTNNSFTILGDISQSINIVSGLKKWEDLYYVFDKASIKYHNVQYNYRSTIEIVTFANQLLKAEVAKPIPVLRNGEKPLIEKVTNSELVSKCIEAVRKYKGLGCKSIAVLVKKKEGSNAIYKELCAAAGDLTINYITENTETYTSGICVIPMKLSKGLEFDAVIIWNASAGNFRDDDTDRKLLYVALTRPLHYLHILYTGTLTPLIVQKNDNIDIVWQKDVWFALSHWGKVTGRFPGYFNKFCYQIGLLLSRNYNLTDKQKEFAQKVWIEAVRLGFNPDSLH